MPASVYQFGEFRLDCSRYELLREGRSIKLERKPLELLILLASSEGRLVARAEIAQRLWETDVFVDTEHGINTAIRKIRAALRDDPESPRFIQTVTGMGYRFIADVIPEPAAPGQEAAAAIPEATEIAAALARSSGRRISAWLGVVTVAGTIVTVLLIVSGPHSLVARLLHRPAPPAIRSLAVLLLNNLSGDPAQDYFADGMTDELITDLAQIPGLRVVSRTSAMQDKGTRKPLAQIARELNVDAVVEGSVVRSGDRVRITAQLIDVRSDRHLWSQNFEGSMNDILALQDNVSREIAAQTQVALTPAARSSLSNARQVDPAAHDAYLRGRYFLERREAEKSAAYFQQAISIDPEYASALAGLADALESEYLLGVASPQAVFGKAAAAARHAIELDPQDSEAYSSLAGIEITYEWNWTAAGQDLKRAVELSPSNAEAQLRYAVYLDAMDQPEDAVAHMRQALSLDPLSFLMNRQMGSTLFFARHYDEALHYLRLAREMEPTKLSVIDCWISWIDEKKGLQDEAVTYDLSSLHEDFPRLDIENLRSVYKRQGWKAYWRARIDALKPDVSPSGSCLSYSLGASYLRLGKDDQAVSWLNRAVDQHCPWVVWAKVDPLLDDLRTDGRYRGLLRRVNLPQ